MVSSGLLGLVIRFRIKNLASEDITLPILWVGGAYTTSLAELTGTYYTFIGNFFVLTTNSNVASLTYLHNLHTRFCMSLMHACTD